MPRETSKNEDLLKEIRDRFTYCHDYWSEIYDQSDVDMRAVAGDPWDPKERAARERGPHPRPCLSLDELNQYFNQVINDIRQNKRGIKVSPAGSGSDDDSAELLAARVRQIEYEGKAVPARITAAENMIQRSFGFYGIGTRYKNDASFDQELYYRRVGNPRAIYVDPDFKEADCSDMGFAFWIDSIPWDKFKRDYPHARTTSFASEQFVLAHGWTSEKRVQVAEYWKVLKEPEELRLLDDGTTLRDGMELPEGRSPVNDVGGKPRTRKIHKRRIVQYITNGLEILEENEWPGQWIPIFPMWGKELFVDDGTGSKRVLLSMTRLARDPYMLYCYYRTNQAEFAGMVPKVPWVAYKGQLVDPERWANAHLVPVGYLEAEATLDATGQTVLPLPTRPQFDASAIIVMDNAAESARRAIQAAMGISPLPTATQRRSEKSGVALERIEASQAKGAYHFNDSYDLAMKHEARVVIDLLPRIEDTEREVSLRNADDSEELVKINTPTVDESGKPKLLAYGTGDYSVTISTGPSFDSQRQEASAFAELLAGNPQIITLAFQGNQPAQKILAAAIKLKALGPIGDQMAEAIDPEEEGQEIPPQAQAIIQQLQQQLAAIDALAKEQQTELGRLQHEKMAKLLELDSKENIAVLQAQSAQLVQEIKNQGMALQTRLQAEFEALAARLVQPATPEGEKSLFDDSTEQQA